MSEAKSALLHRDPAYDYPVIVRGEGIYLFDDLGKRYIDGGAGATNVTLGHGRHRIVEAMAEQADTLAYVFSTNFANQPAIELAERIASIAPGDLNHVYFVSGGSEGIESCLKMVRLYQQQRGNPNKQKVIARWRSYHGGTIGALSLTGMPWLRRNFDSWLLPFPHIETCYPYRCKYQGCLGECNLSCADELERTILETGPENVAAFISEPVGMAGVGALAPPPDYFPRIREICDKYEVLLIMDEVISGFGRTGKFFAIEHWDVIPDLIVFGKGASGGYSPLGGVLLRSKISDALKETCSAFPHIFTYVNNPVSARAGLEVLDIIEEENLVEHVSEIGGYLFERAELLKRHPIVGEIRGKGLLFCLELVKDRVTKEPFPASFEISRRLHKCLMHKGLSCIIVGSAPEWKSGDDIRLSPPFNITRDQVEEIVGILDEGLFELQQELSVL